MKQYSLLAFLSIIMIVFVMAFIKKGTEQPGKHLEIILRNIGHEVLLQSKDSTSQVLPVETLNENMFRISFENSFMFIPDTLINIVQKQLAKTDRLEDYTVCVNECYQNKTIFAYEVNTRGGDLKPCRGREQKKGCYVIEISFLHKKSFSYGWLLLAIIPVAGAGFYVLRKRTKISDSKEPLGDKVGASISTKDELIPVIAEYEMLGNFMFFESKRILNLNGESIELSAKEAKALSILAANRHEVVGRDQLMKEIWEYDGVVVITRNVDVLISKLRKRLRGDPSIKIVNVHGKGYKMIA